VFRTIPLVGVRGVRTPEFDMMELVNRKPVALWVVAHEVVIANQLHFVAVHLAVLWLAGSLLDHTCYDNWVREQIVVQRCAP
jgi:hypothetical protein